MGVFRNANQRTVQEHGSGRRVGRTRAVLAALGLVLAAVPFMATATASGAGFVPARSVGVSQGGFPLWFQDANGVRAELCLDPADTNCLAPLSGPGFDQNLPVSFPDNYPDEVFYSAVDSQPITATDLACSPAGGTIDVHLALEAAYFNGAPAVGDQAVFGRIRMNADPGSGLCGSTWYTFKTPYGPVTLQTEPDGALLGGAAAAATVDIGCFPTPTVPCAFNETLTAPVLQVGFLQQAVGAPQGYLGDGSFGAVTGGLDGFNQVEIYKWPAGDTPSATGYDAPCVGACELVGSTANFAVLTKLAGPISPAVESFDFGGQVITTTATSAAIDLTNVGGGALGLDPTTIDDIVVDGAGFGLGSTSCSVGTVTSPDPATPLARDASCWVTVTFTPGATGALAGTLAIYSNGNPTPEVVQLAGTGINAGDAPTADLSTGNLDFLDVRVRTVSDIQTVTIANNGTAPLLLQPSIAGVDAALFQILGNSCPSGFVPAGQTCTIEVRFVPAADTIASASLNLHTNIGDPVVVLNGSGYGGVAAVSTTTDPINTFPDWYQDENGTRVGQCVQPTNPMCVTAPVTGALSFPDNYPDEWFYYVANSAPLEIADATCDAEPGSIMVEAAAEAAFLGAIAPNEGITFGRLRIVAHGGLCANTEYILTHPYGRIAIFTNENGDIKPNMGTTDIGCTTLPCDYTQALSSPVLESFLEQTVRPGGWLGDPLQPSTVTGSPFDDPFTGLPANHFYVQRAADPDVPSSIIAYTDQFTVSGRLVGPVVATPGSITFDPAEAGVSAAATTASVTYTNTGVAPITLDADDPVTVIGNRATEFTIDGTTCGAGDELIAGASCTVDLRFAPLGTGNRDAAVVLHHSGKNSPTEVPLDGIGLAPAGSAAFSAVRDTVQFTDLHVRDAINPVGSESQDVVISNVGGQAALEVLGVSVPVGADYVITGNACVGVLVQPGETCTITVRFAPDSVGNHDVDLTVTGQTFTGDPEAPGVLADVVVALKAKANVAEPTLSEQSTNGFPNWIQDRNGVRLEQCLVTDGNCVLLPDATFNPGQPVSFPGNYPVESFYSIVDSEILSFGGQVCGDGSTSAGGTALLRVAVEAAFTSPQPQAGTQNLFNRIRITADGLCANTTYTFMTPYGPKAITTDGDGVVKPNAGTFDNTNITGTEPTSRSFLQWDPNEGATAPAGYLGSPNVLHTVVGSTFVPAGASEPANYFAILGGAGEFARTDQFLVSGRLAGPVVSSLSSKDFGVVEGGGHSLTQTIVVTNIGSTPVSELEVSMGGIDAAQFTVHSETCTAAVSLGLDEHCEIVVGFDPAVVAVQTTRNATLTFTHNGLRSPVTVALTGRANPPETPALTVSPTSFAFAATNVGATASTLITVRNSGTGPLRLEPLPLVNPDFAITGTTCPTGEGTTLGAGVSCTVTARFNPASRGAKTGTLAVTAHDAVTTVGHTDVVMPTVNVNLSGTATQPTVTVTPTTLNISGQAGRAQTGRVTIANTGNGNFSLSSPVPGQASIQFFAIAGATNNPVPRFSATHNCNNIAPGRSCTVTVSFTALATAPIGTVYRVDMKLFGNASNLGGLANPAIVRVNGTRNK
jgi:hypothetical protein